MKTSTSALNRGATAPDFSLPGVDGRQWTRDAVAGKRGLLVMFICNHCPYVQAVLDRIVRDTNELRGLGVGCVAISSNDVVTYAEDSFDNMKLLAQRHKFEFPYLYDESQQVAHAYGAVCTPDFFGYNAELALEYRGRIDASGMNAAPANSRRELFEAMRQIADTGVGPADQNASIGCSIKWRS